MNSAGTRIFKLGMPFENPLASGAIILSFLRAMSGRMALAQQGIAAAARGARAERRNTRQEAV
jgi:tryptophan synthase alpha subunit